MLKRTLAAAAISLIAITGAHAEDSKMQRNISVSGHGEVETAPDMASLSLGVFTNAKTAAASLDANTGAMKKLFAMLKTAGINEKDMQTSNLMVNPHYEQSNDGSNPRVTGFDVSNNVTITIRDLTMVGTILDQAVKSGANQVNGLSFGLKDNAKALDDARKLAIADARHRAEIFADASGVSIGNVLMVTENGSYQPQPMAMAKADMMNARAVPIAQGMQTIAVDVNVSWEIK